MAVLRQGRRTPNKKGAGSWIFTICVAICLGVIAWYIMSESLIYTAEGVKISFFNKKKDDTVNTTAPTLNITTEAPTTEAPTTTAPVLPKTPSLSARWIDINDLAKEDFVNALLSENVEQVGFWLKNYNGIVNIPFTSQLSNPDGLVNAQAQDIANGIKKLKDNDVYIISSISVCRDPIMPRQFRNDCIQTGQSQTWLDSNNLTWFKPSADSALSYTKELIKAAEDIGVDEIILSNLSFPYLGKRSYIGPQDAPKAEDIEEFCKNLKDLDILVGLEYISQPEDITGQNISNIAQYFDRVYTSAPYDTEEYNNLVNKLDDEKKAVVITSAKPENPNYNYIVR